MCADGTVFVYSAPRTSREVKEKPPVVEVEEMFWLNYFHFMALVLC